MDFGFSRVHVLNSCARLSSTLPVLNFPQKDYIFFLSNATISLSKRLTFTKSTHYIIIGISGHL